MERQVRTVATADGMALAAEVAGRSGLPPNAPTIVLAHDWGLSRLSWDRVVRRLVPAGVRVVTWDHRGHGASSLGVHAKTADDLTVDHLGHDLHAVLKALVPPEAPVILVGHSLGGMAAMAYLTEYPIEARSRVVGAVLASTAAVDVRLGQPNGRRFARLGRRTGTHVDEQPVRNHREVLFGDEPDDEALQAVRDQFAAVDRRVVRAAYRAFCRADVRGSFEALRQIPVSILVGAADRVTPPTRARAMTITLTDARFTTIARAGHMLPYEAPDRIVAEIRWVLLAVRARAAPNGAPAAPAAAPADPAPPAPIVDGEAAPPASWRASSPEETQRRSHVWR